MSDMEEPSAQGYSEAFASSTRKPRKLKDPIYDYIDLSDDLFQFIDTLEFQRLHNVKQLGTSCYVWPSASHNRFEHSLGVAHLAGKMIDTLRQEQPGLGITDRDKHCVQLAGLLHDLGHGPFSHVFDSKFMPAALEAKGTPGTWEHEQGSELMFDALLEENNIKMKPKDIEFVKDLIQGKVRRSTEPKHKMFLFQIVANKRNGIDVDKLDYLARDTWATGEHNTIAFRLIYSARVLEGNICFDVKDAIQVYHLFHSRFNMHKRIYHHKTARAMEYMVVDALLAADKFLKISDRVYNAKMFRTLSDAIVTEIEDDRNANVPELAKSRDILLRWRRRQLYRAVDFRSLPYAIGENKHFRDAITAENIVASAKAQCKKDESPIVQAKGDKLQPEHVIVDFALVHWGMKDKNPLDMVDFYSNKNPKPRKIDAQDLTNSLPREFAEYHLRIYTRDPSLFGVIQAGFRALLLETSVPDSPAPHPLDNDDDNTVDDHSERPIDTAPPTPSRAQTPLQQDPPPPSQGLLRTPPVSRAGSKVLQPAGPVTPKPSRSPPDQSELPKVSGNKFMGTPINFEYPERATDPGSPTVAAAAVQKRGAKRAREPDDEDLTPRRRSRSSSAANALAGPSAPPPGSSGKRKSARLGGGASSATNDGK